MTRPVPSVEYDFGYLRAAIPILENYLLSKDLYWALADSSPRGSPAYPQLTIGNLLLADARLNARQFSFEIQVELERLDNMLWAIAAKWRQAWQNKSGRDFSARLRLWRDFLEEYRAQPDNHIDRYPYEVGRRVQLELLANQLDEIPAAEHELLAGLDKMLGAVFVPGGFVWDADLVGGFPNPPFWYLYGQVGER
jgi:hypothetical protein